MTDRVINVDIGDGASMMVPLSEWCWQLRYNRKEPDRGTLCDDRMLAASVCESFRYLILECTRDEAWRRIKLLRAGLMAEQVEP